MSSTTRVLIGLVAGLVTGITLATFAPSVSAAVVPVVEPVGTIWLRALQMTVVPLVVSLLITGVTSASDAAATGRLAVRTLTLFTVLLAAAALFTALAAPVLFRVWPADPDRVAALRDTAPRATSTLRD